MKRKVLVVVALMLALSVTMAAMAYSNAAVSNNTSLTITDTDKSTLALTPSKTIENTDGVAAFSSTSPQKLVFNFNKGNGGAEFGLQPDSSYQWDELFYVTNNAGHSVKVQLIQHPGDGMFNDSSSQYANKNSGVGLLVVMYPENSNQGVTVYQDGPTNDFLTLAPGAKARVLVRISVGSKPTASKSCTLVVRSYAVK